MLKLIWNLSNLIMKYRRNVWYPNAFRFHDLRHTFATQAIAGGVNPKSLSHLLGHTKASFSLDRYTHVTNEMQAGAAAGEPGGRQACRQHTEDETIGAAGSDVVFTHAPVVCVPERLPAQSNKLILLRLEFRAILNGLLFFFCRKFNFKFIIRLFINQ